MSMLPMIVDNFAGGGGASTGIEMGLGAHIDVAINHDGDAVAMHRMNHPHTKHLQQSVWKADPQDVCGKRRVRLAWFSPDCKHFSKAKGGKPVEHHIRDLAWVVVQWAHRIKPDVIMLENVEEFKDWGPLISTADGKLVPCPLRKGLTFRRWVRELKKCGYVVEYRELRACDYGAPTIRKRLFLIARCDGKPIVWPAPTHGKGLIPYRTAAECIDWSIPCPSIFERKKPLAENTLKRIAKGIFKYVIDAEKPFIVQYYGQKRSGDDRTADIDDPLPTQTTENRFAVVEPYIINMSHGGKVEAGDQPISTIATEKGGCRAIVTPYLASLTHHGSDRVEALDEPFKTITGAHRGEKALIVPYLAGVGGRAGQSPERPVDKPYHTTTAKADTVLVTPILVGAGGPAYSGKPTSVDKPYKAQTTENHTAVVQAFLSQHNSSSIGQSLNEPQTTATQKGKHALTSVFLAQHNGEREGGFIGAKSVEAPVSTLTATGAQQGIVAAHLINLKGSDRRDAPADGPTPTQTSGGYHIGEVRAFLLKYYGNDKQGVSLNDPMHSVTAKDRFGLVTIQGVDYQIVDIGMRMLTPRELFRAQGFPDSYKIEFGMDANGNLVKLTKTAQVKLCGNSVSPPMAAALARANCGPDIDATNFERAAV